MKKSDHPFAEIFPLLDADSLSRLADDIKANGLNNPITLFEGAILDGRNRYRACLQAGVEPRFVEFENSDPVSFVISSNALRRDLTKSQRAAIAVTADELLEGLRKETPVGRPSKNRAKIPELDGERPRDRLGKLFGVSARYIQDALAIKVLPHLLEEIKARKEAQWQSLLDEFSDLATLFNEVFTGDKKLSDAINRARLLDYHKKRVEAEIAKAQKAEVILANPPWRYENPGSPSRQIENHYDTQELETIKARKPRSADDCVLFLWAPAPKLTEAIEVMAAWGFVYRTNLVWDKQIAGMGHWSRVRHELLLVGVRGHPRTPNDSLLMESIFSEKRTEHSVKPVCIYKYLESVFADRIRLEMYARSKREGWMSWGDEI
jgi:N6-adenosine-specific RNA methylase IME4